MGIPDSGFPLHDSVLQLSQRAPLPNSATGQNHPEKWIIYAFTGNKRCSCK